MTRTDYTLPEAFDARGDALDTAADRFILIARALSEAGFNAQAAEVQAHALDCRAAVVRTAMPDLVCVELVEVAPGVYAMPE